MACNFIGDGVREVGFTSIISDETFGSRNASRMTLTTPLLVLDGHGSISTTAFASGNGGAIDIATAELDLRGGSDIFAATFKPV